MTMLQFDTAAWLTNMELRDCSPHDRGILIDLMCLAHRGDPYGHIAKGGSAKQPHSIADYLRIDRKEFSECVKRLMDSGRIGIAEQSGAIYIPRMVRDGSIAAASKEGGMRGGNPALITRKEKAERSAPITVEVYWSELPMHLRTPAIRDAVTEWLEYRKRRRIVLTQAAIKRQVGTLTPLSPEQAVQWITCAIDRGWQSFYPPPADRYQPKQQLTHVDHKTTKEFTGHAAPKVINF